MCCSVTCAYYNVLEGVVWNDGCLLCTHQAVNAPHFVSPTRPYTPAHLFVSIFCVQVPPPGLVLSQLSVLGIHELASLNHLLAVLKQLPVTQSGLVAGTPGAAAPVTAVTAVAATVLMPALSPSAPAEAAANRQAMIHNLLLM